MTNISVTTAIRPAAEARPAVQRKSPMARGRVPVLLLFLPPALLLFSIFVILPMGEAAWYSLYKWDGYGLPTQFVGLRNFEVLLKNGAFLTALKNNALIIVISIAIQIPLAIWLSMMLAHRIAGVVLFRLIFFLPYVLAEVAAGLIWRFVYDGDYGLFASAAHLFGFETPYVLADKDLAIYAVLAVIVWKYFGFHMMLFIAGLQSLDKSVLEAAEIDGASGWQKFRYITLPLLGVASFGFLRRRRFAAAFRSHHAADRWRAVQCDPDNGDLPFQFRGDPHAGGARQRRRRRALRHLRDACLRLQTDIHAQ
jgi:raffinose/stachyose/melibiose transport system permease protein